MIKERFTLEFPTKKHKEAALDFIQEFIDEEVHPCGTNKLYTVLQSSGTYASYEEWLESCKNNRTGDTSINGVPTETYFMVRQHDERIVGMVTIRLRLNDRYWNNGGNIGYSIRKSERGKGYAKINLFLALLTCYKHDIEAVLLDCDKENVASSRTMLALDAMLIREKWSDMYYCWNQVYVIGVNQSVVKYYDDYMYKIY